MTSSGARLSCIGVAVVTVAALGQAQNRSSGPQGSSQSQAKAAAAPAAPADPRVGLKPGLRDAGQAARNIQLVASLTKPQGFFDPKAPAGEPTPPERVRQKSAEDAEDDDETPDPTEPRPPRPQLAFANSDLAFQGAHLFVGSFHGFNTYDIEDPRKARLMASVVCPGGQGDVSVHRNLLIMSVEETRGRLDCGTQGVDGTVSAGRFRGVRIFDISDVRRPKQVAAVQTCRGSHTHTLVIDPDDAANLYVYGSGTSAVRSADELAGCSGKGPKEDPNTSLFSIDVIQVPLAAPGTARIISRPRIFADPATGDIAGLWPGGRHGAGTQRTSLTNRCHDITVFPAKHLAAGACSGNGILLDISDPVKPVRLDAVIDKNFAFWHSATFNNDGSKVIFTDEWGGGTRPRCRATDPPTWGANAVFDIVDRKLRFGGYYKLPVPQTDQENCVAHNGSIIPVPGRDIMVQAWYQGGLTVFDFTDSTRPFEIAFFDRGPLDAKQLITGGYWSTYWYNGEIYATEIARGLDIFRLTPSEHLTQNELEAATEVRLTEFNAQQQPQIVWPATSVVARAYLDQLTRSRTINAERGRAVTTLLQRADRLRSPKDSGAAAVAEQLETLAAHLASDGERAAGADANRLKSLAANLKARAANLR
jgi:hypothetical protein